MGMDATSVKSLVEEYKTLCTDISFPRPISDEIAWQKITELLHQKGEWTLQGSEHVIHLAKTYGSFVLRNALALAIVLDIEDGSLNL